jgi:hypothetical protein
MTGGTVCPRSELYLRAAGWPGDGYQERHCARRAAHCSRPTTLPCSHAHHSRRVEGVLAAVSAWMFGQWLGTSVSTIQWCTYMISEGVSRLEQPVPSPTHLVPELSFSTL